MLIRSLFLLLPLLATSWADYPFEATLPDGSGDSRFFVAGDRLAQRIPGTNRIVYLADAPLENATWKAAPDRDGAKVQVRESEESLSVSVGDRRLLNYNIATQTGPEGTDPAFHRSGYIHPIYNPRGEVISGDFEADHPHQHGLFYAWTNTTFEGKKIDFWNQLKQQGRISHDKVLSTQSGPIFGQFQVELNHDSILNPDEPKPVLREVWTVRAYALGGEAMVFDLESEQTCVADTPLTINEYHYGAMAIRGGSGWLVDEAGAEQIKEWTKALKKDPQSPAPEIPDLPRDYLTDKGKHWDNGNHTQAKWVSMHGKLEEGPSGIALLSSPDNFRAPQYVRLHPSKPYFCYAPQIAGEFQIQPGETYRSAFRIVLHTGEPDPEFLNAHWDAYAH